MIEFELQPTLKNNFVVLTPLEEKDFERLYTVASDPLIWEQHPRRDRYQKEVFQVFFQEAIQSGGALLFQDAKTHEVIGSSRYYELDQVGASVAIGYTFLARKCWGKGYNPAIKVLMVNHAFRFVNRIYFHIGQINKRSQIAVERLGAVHCGLRDQSLIYELSHSTWYAGSSQKGINPELSQGF